MAILQQFFIPVIPDGAPIVIPENQYDYDDANYAGRLVFNLVYQGIVYDLTGASAIIQGTKPDGKVFAYPATVDGSAVRAKLTQQMTAVYGRTVGNIIVNDADGNRIGTFNFWMEVQKSAIDGSADPSETEIPALVALASAQAMAAQQSATEAASSAEAAADWSANPAYIGLNGNWYVYDPQTGLYVDSGVDARGKIGNKWYTGLAIAGKSSTPTAYTTGIDLAYEGDMYLNKSEGAIYTCTTEGDEATALWVYVMTLSGGGGGATVLSDLADVQIAMLAGGQILQYNSTAGKWENVTPSAGATALASLTDVDLTALADGQILQYDSATSKWVNVTISPGGASSLAALDDVDLTSLADEQILRYNSTAGKWENENFPTIPTVTDTYNSSSHDGMSGVAVASAISGKLDGSVVSTATSSDGVTVTFTGVDLTKGYGLQADYPGGYNAAPVSITNMQTVVTSGDTGNIIYTLYGATASQSFRLVQIG